VEIYGLFTLSPIENLGIPEIYGGKKGITVSSNAKGIPINLKTW
jgi:hypothetical protein